MNEINFERAQEFKNKLMEKIDSFTENPNCLKIYPDNLDDAIYNCKIEIKHLKTQMNLFIQMQQQGFQSISSYNDENQETNFYKNKPKKVWRVKQKN
ncbi:Hypothetical protein KVN_LOCUS398 [uncultured virus]|nr:Hypothetical protein KVN_LOCUS398 [uncultured virus]